MLTVKEKSFLNAAAVSHRVHDPARLDPLIHADVCLPFLLSGVPRVLRDQTMISRDAPLFFEPRVENIADEVSGEDKLCRVAISTLTTTRQRMRIILKCSMPRVVSHAPCLVSEHFARRSNDAIPLFRQKDTLKKYTGEVYR